MSREPTIGTHNCVECRGAACILFAHCPICTACVVEEPVGSARWLREFWDSPVDRDTKEPHE